MPSVPPGRCLTGLGINHGTLKHSTGAVLALAPTNTISNLPDCGQGWAAPAAPGLD